MANPNLLLANIEQRHLWAYFHKDWLLEIRRLLRQQLPSNYRVFVESESILLSPDIHETASASLPDLAVARSHSATEPKPEPTTATTAVIELDEPYEIASKYSLLIRRSPENQVVAALEILSPSNKGLGNRFDRDKYLRKRDAYIEAGISFMEIDALTHGERVLPDSLLRLMAFERNAWTSFHNSGVRRLRGYGWNIADPLPAIPWSIEGDLCVFVNLGAAANSAFEFNQWQSLVSEPSQ